MDEWTKDEGRSDSNWLTFVTHSSCKLTNTVTVNTTEPTVPILPPLLSHQLGTHLSHFTLLFFESTFNILRHGRLKTNDHTYHMGNMSWQNLKIESETPCNCYTNCIYVLFTPASFFKGTSVTCRLPIKDSCNFMETD